MDKKPVRKPKRAYGVAVPPQENSTSAAPAATRDERDTRNGAPHRESRTLASGRKSFRRPSQGGSRPAGPRPQHPRNDSQPRAESQPRPKTIIDPSKLVPFGELALSVEMLAATTNLKFSTPTPIQEQVIPFALQGRDVIGLAQTGTGKTASFLIPIIELHGRGETRRPKRPFVLVLTPTRELALQVEEHCRSLASYMDFNSAAVLGGVSMHGQIQALNRGVNLLVATPGRLLDLMERGAVNLDGVHTVVVDEADRMFDMGFLPDVNRILKKVPTERQTLLFSATMPPEIQALCARFLREPERVEIARGRVADGVEQLLFEVPRDNKKGLLKHLLESEKMPSVLVFLRTQRGADGVHRLLERGGFAVAKVHGRLSQAARQRSLRDFKSGKTPILIATNVAARGLDISGISHVINFDVPEVPDDYVHRVGRTARAASKGHAWTFAADYEMPLIRDIEKSINAKLPRRIEEPFCVPARPEAKVSHPGSGKGGSNHRRRRKR